jgi:uncharacterized protein YndB with AHSA1/START domain
MTDSLKMSILLPAKPQEVYEGWLNSKTHSIFTGGSSASIDSKLNGKYTAWDGYINGKNLELEPYTLIVQSWRTTDFPTDAPDSRLEVRFEEKSGKTKMTLIHTHLPEDQVEIGRAHV